MYTVFTFVHRIADRGFAGHCGDNSGDVLQWDDCGLLSSNEGPKQCNSKFNLQRTVTFVRVEHNLFIYLFILGTEREKLRMQLYTQRFVHGTIIAVHMLYVSQNTVCLYSTSHVKKTA